MPFKVITDWQRSYIDSGKYAGSSVLIHQGGKERFFSAVGLRDIERNQPFTRDTVVRLYSMTKPVTSLAILMLVERGELKLDTPLDAILPEFSNPKTLRPHATHIDQTEPGQAPTILHLLTHQAGFSYAFNTGLLPQAMKESSFTLNADKGALEQQIRELAKLPLAFHPGQRWEYSTAIDILGRVIEVITGQSLAEFLHQEILSVLGMNETGFCVQKHQKDRFAALYSVGEEAGFNVDAVTSETAKLHLSEARENSAFMRTSLYSGGGGLVGTIDDYAKFTNMLLCDGKVDQQQLINPETARIMRQNHLPGEIADMGPTSFAEQPMKGMGFGLGGSVLLDPERAETAGSVGDFSWGGIASTYFWIDPAQQLSVIFFTQLLPSSAYPSRAELKSLVSDALASQ